MSNPSIQFKDYLEEELRMRYAPQSILPFSDNEAIFTFFNDEKHISKEQFTKKPVMNSNIILMNNSLLDMFRDDPNQKDMPYFLDSPFVKKLLHDLNLTPTKEDFRTIREKNIKLGIIGYGGAMINMLHNMYLWSMDLSETQVFEKIVVFEKDNIDFSNLPRIGKNIVFDYRADFTAPFDEDIPALKLLSKLSLITEEKELSKTRKIISFNGWFDQKAAELMTEKGYVFIGAPSLETRQMLQDKPFYFLGHGDYEVEICYQPQITSGLVQETYGTIDIPVLLINLALATAAFIKTLAYGETPSTNEKLFVFDMKQYLEENKEELKEIFNV